MATVTGAGAIVNVYTSCYLAQYIGSNKGEYHGQFLRLFPFIEHTLGTGTPGDVFESDFRFHLEQSHKLRDAQVAVMGAEKAQEIMVVLGRRCGSDESKVCYPAGQINSLYAPSSDQVALQKVNLRPDDLPNVAQWFIPESKTQPFLDFMVLVPRQSGDGKRSWSLVAIQNTVGKTHTADTGKLNRVVGGLLLAGFVLEETITIVFVIEDAIKSGKIASALEGGKLNCHCLSKQFVLKVVHSVYDRTAGVPK